MKPDVRFNHDAKTVAEALGIKETAEKISDSITDVVQDWMATDDSGKHSKLAEVLHKNLPYEIILFLATKEVQTKLAETLTEVNVLDKLIKAMDELIEQKEIDEKAKLN
jgi:hypothetical protein